MVSKGLELEFQFFKTMIEFDDDISPVKIYLTCN